MPPTPLLVLDRVPAYVPGAMLDVKRPQREKFVICACFLSVLLTTACSGVDIPDGPDLESLWNSYSSPAGSLPEDVEAVMAAAQLAYSQVQSIGSLKFVTDTLEPVAEAITKVTGNETSLEERIRLSGVTDVKHTCPGAESNATTDESNGNITYKVTLKENWLQAVLWGKFDDCQVHAQGEAAILNGTWAISVGQAQSLKNLDLNLVLFSLTAELEFQGRTEQIEKSFRVDNMDLLEVLIPADHGSVVFGFSTSSYVSLRTSDGSFCCDFDNRECFALNGDTCDDSDAGGQRISW